jgi:hypothetical protein
MYGLKGLNKMKITKRQLKRIIREEYAKINNGTLITESVGKKSTELANQVKLEVSKITSKRFSKRNDQDLIADAFDSILSSSDFDHYQKGRDDIIQRAVLKVGGREEDNTAARSMGCKWDSSENYWYTAKEWDKRKYSNASYNY